MSDLTTDSITFGKYKGSTLQIMLKDTKYCEWILKQDWFQTSYGYLYNRVKEYNPLIYFFSPVPTDKESFLETYQYFNLVPIEDLKISLTENEKKCYSFYLSIIDELKNKVYRRIEKNENNPFDIKAPIRWLQKFEKENIGTTRIDLKIFLASYKLINIPYIIEDIKKHGGLVYKGAQSFNIAKKRSLEQESFWEKVLKELYGEDIGSQFKYENCIFDFLNIKTNTIFECKLSLKDFNADQYKKYLLALSNYNILYLVGYDCLINIKERCMYTTDYEHYQKQILKTTNQSYSDFDILERNSIQALFDF